MCALTSTTSAAAPVPGFLLFCHPKEVVPKRSRWVSVSWSRRGNTHTRWGQGKWWGYYSRERNLSGHRRDEGRLGNDWGWLWVSGEVDLPATLRRKTRSCFVCCLIRFVETCLRFVYRRCWTLRHKDTCINTIGKKRFTSWRPHNRFLIQSPSVQHSFVGCLSPNRLNIGSSVVFSPTDDQPSSVVSFKCPVCVCVTERVCVCNPCT